MSADLAIPMILEPRSAVCETIERSTRMGIDGDLYRPAHHGLASEAALHGSDRLHFSLLTSHLSYSVRPRRVIPNNLQRSLGQSLSGFDPVPGRGTRGMGQRHDIEPVTEFFQGPFGSDQIR